MVIGRPADLAARQRNSLRVDRVQKPPLSGRMDLTMASVLRASGRGLICVAGLAAAISVSLTQSACAFGRRSPTVANQNGRGAPAPMVARYAIDEGGEFILDRHAHNALIKFSDSQEVWSLAPYRGPRGDIIYKNDVNEPMLRATKLGGMTVFTQRRPEGAAAALIGAGAPLKLATLGPVLLYQHLYQASVRSSRAAQHQIEVDAPDVDPSSDGLIADTASVVIEAMIDLAGRPGGHAILARLGTIAIQTGNHPAVSLRGRVVAISVDPTQGFAGRPSSERILQALGAH